MMLPAWWRKIAVKCVVRQVGVGTVNWIDDFLWRRIVDLGGRLVRGVAEACGRTTQLFVYFALGRIPTGIMMGLGMPGVAFRCVALASRTLLAGGYPLCIQTYFRPFLRDWCAWNRVGRLHSSGDGWCWRLSYWVRFGFWNSNRPVCAVPLSLLCGVEIIFEYFCFRVGVWSNYAGGCVDGLVTSADITLRCSSKMALCLCSTWRASLSISKTLAC